MHTISGGTVEVLRNGREKLSRSCGSFKYKKKLFFWSEDAEQDRQRDDVLDWKRPRDDEKKINSIRRGEEKEAKKNSIIHCFSEISFKFLFFLCVVPTQKTSDRLLRESSISRPAKHMAFFLLLLQLDLAKKENHSNLLRVRWILEISLWFTAAAAFWCLWNFYTFSIISARERRLLCTENFIISW